AARDVPAAPRAGSGSVQRRTASALPLAPVALRPPARSLLGQHPLRGDAQLRLPRDEQLRALRLPGRRTAARGPPRTAAGSAGTAGRVLAGCLFGRVPSSALCSANGGVARRSR